MVEMLPQAPSSNISTIPYNSPAIAPIVNATVPPNTEPIANTGITVTAPGPCVLMLAARNPSTSAPNTYSPFHAPATVVDITIATEEVMLIDALQNLRDGIR